MIDGIKKKYNRPDIPVSRITLKAVVTPWPDQNSFAEPSDTELESLRHTVKAVASQNIFKRKKSQSPTKKFNDAV